MNKKSGLKKIKKALKSLPKPTRGIHSEIHAIAKEISEYCAEPKKFALYLGIIKRIGKNRAHQIFSEIKQSKNIKSPAKLFMFLSKTKKSLGKKQVLKIETGKNNPILRKKSLKIKEINKDIQKLAEDMLEIMEKNNGIGLSACQIGKNIQLFVIPKNLSTYWTFINPEITKLSKKTQIIEEGCLSLPNIFIPVKRATSLKIKALNENNKQFKIKAKGLLARVIQHENDHLHGILITDK